MAGWEFIFLLRLSWPVNKAGSRGSELPGFVLDGNLCVCWHWGSVNLWNGEWTHPWGWAVGWSTQTWEYSSHSFDISAVSQLPRFTWFCCCFYFHQWPLAVLLLLSLLSTPKLWICHSPKLPFPQPVSHFSACDSSCVSVCIPVSSQFSLQTEEPFPGISLHFHCWIGSHIP